MPSHLENLLTSAGLPAEDAAKIVALPEAEQATFDAKPYAEKIRANYQTQFKNDPSFFEGITIENLPPAVKKSLEAGQYARATNVTKEKLAKALGFNEEEIRDLATEDFKSLDFYVPALADKYAKTKAGDKELQNQLIAERKRNEEFQSKYGPDYEQTVKTKYETEANQKITSAIFNSALIGELSSIPGLKIAASDIAKTAADILQNKYAFEKVGDFSVELRQKDNPAMKVLKKDSSHELTLKEALMNIATERGWIAEESQNQPGSGKVKIEPGKEGKLFMVPPHLQDKIGNKIATEA